MSVPTPHIGASLGEIAPFVLMPGDPLRAKWIAETYLEDPACYNQVRGMLGYTGTFRGKKVSVQGSGMGMPSMGIYSYELFHFYGVETIVRVGSAGALQDDLNIGDLVVAAGCSSFTRYLDQFGTPGAFAPLGNFELAAAAVKAAREKGFRCVAGNVLSSDTFYDDDPDFLRKWQRMGVLAVEMETAALYANAARAGKRALGIFTVSDCPFKGLATTAEQRQTAFTGMVETALELLNG